MNHELCPLKNASAEQVSQLARLHQQELASLLSDVGLPVVRRFYQLARADPNVLGYIALGRQSEVLGGVVGTNSPWVLHGQLCHPLYWFVGQALRAFLQRPRVLWQVIISRLFTVPRSVYDPNAVKLLYIVVTPDVRGQGIGRKLLERFLIASRANGFERVILSVETENKRALEFYSRVGFTPTKRPVRKGRFLKHLELTLSNPILDGTQVDSDREHEETITTSEIYPRW